jgi:hypothetical protein
MKERFTVNVGLFGVLHGRAFIRYNRLEQQGNFGEATNQEPENVPSFAIGAVMLA